MTRRGCGIATALVVASLMYGRSLAAQVTVAAHETSSDARAVEELLARPVTVRLKGVSLQRAIDSISRAANIIVQYQVPALALYQTPVTIDVKKVPLGTVLDRILSGTALRVTSNGQGDLTIVSSSATGQDSLPATGTVSGRVLDSASGRGLSGATVRIVGTKRAIVTEDSGRFVLRDVPIGEQRVSIKMFGRRPAERVVRVVADGTVTVRVTLPAIANVLSGVVTTATGEQSRRQVGNDITVIDVQEVMKTAPIRTVTDLLETRVPGLTVQRTSGAPGAPSRIRLRGVGGGLLPNGIGATNDPIVIVDGIRVYANQSGARDQNLAPAPGGAGSQIGNYPPPSPLDQIDPNSIDKIEVFKGPSASAMYGSDAANGVIVITTKRGRAGPTHLDVSLAQGIDYLPGVYAPSAYYAFGHGYGGLLQSQCSYSDYHCHVDSLVYYQALKDPRLSMVGRGSRSEGSATVTGGTEQLSYAVTGSGTHTLGLFKMPDVYKDLYAQLYGRTPPTWMQRPATYTTWGVNGNFTIQPRRGLRASLMSSLSHSNQLQTSGQTQLSALAGTYFDTTRITPAILGEYANKVTSEAVTSNNTASVDWGWRQLPLSAQVGVSTVDRTDRSLVPYGVYGPSAGCQSTDSTGCYTMGHGQSEQRTANVNTRLFPDYWITTAVGLNVIHSSTQDFQGSAYRLQPGVSSPATFNESSQQGSALTTAGWFIEPKFNFNSRFFVLPGYRIDGGSASGARGGTNGGLFALFPKLQLSWIAIDREGASPLAGFLTFLRPRLAVGVAGVQPDPSWKFRLADNGSTTNPFPGLIVSTLGNTQIHPERSREVEGGFEAELWGQALTLGVTYYNKLRTDAISKISVAPSVYGGLPYYVNIGKVRNTGVELQAKAELIHTTAVSWNVTASYSSDKNELLTLNGREPYIDLGDGTRLVPGYPLNGRWEKPILGYRLPGPEGRLLPSDIQVADSAVYVGQQIPKYTLPFSSALSLFRGMVSVNATFSYQNGLTQFNANGGDLLTRTLTDPGATLGQQAAALAAATGLTKYGLIQTVNTFRFSELSLNYQIPSSFSKRFRVPRMGVALQGSNLGLWTNYHGKDPNVNAFTVGDKTEDRGQLPEPRSWSLRFSFSN